MSNSNRRAFIKNIAVGTIGATILPETLLANNAALTGVENSDDLKQIKKDTSQKYNGTYQGEFLNRIAFPVGGIGAGMFCIDGNGAITHMSVRNIPQVYNEPAMFAALSLKNKPDSAIVLEGPVQGWKKFGQANSAAGWGVNTWGLPRFEHVNFKARFPFAEINLADSEFPVKVNIQAWSPFIPNDEDASSLPVGAIEYTFKNSGTETADYVFSYNSCQFMSQKGTVDYIKPVKGSFVLGADGTEKEPEKQGEFAIFTDEDAIVDCAWFRGAGHDPLSMAWNVISSGTAKSNAPVNNSAPGASLFIPFALKPGQEKKIRLMMAWFVPVTNLHEGFVDPAYQKRIADNPSLKNYKPWYASKFKSINEVVNYWAANYEGLRTKTQLFTNTFYNNTLPPEVTEAVAANLTILKSPTVLRQADGRFWGWEGAGDNYGSCFGSCTHVWNYAQALSHLFPALERTMRETEFNESQTADGRQAFRANLPISPIMHTSYSDAADGQLGGIMKAYREWRISGDDGWLKKMYPKIKASLDYSIKTWDPKNKGIIEEPHHNTYDIQFWGPTSYATSYYLGALQAIIQMGSHLKQDVALYKKLYTAGKATLEGELFDGEYFFQKIEWENLKTLDPNKNQVLIKSQYNNPESLKLLKTEGPKYQYGKGCLSDGVIGNWLARMCGLNDVIDTSKVKSHINAVYKYNFKHNLRKHSNPQRTNYAIGTEGGLLLCTWPKGGRLSLPFIYSNEVWTGIEYQVASQLMLVGEVEKALTIVRACRDRYDGITRNPFNEYECGHWYARAMASYGMLEALTGVRYDAVTKTLYIDSKIGDFKSFLSTNTGYGNVSLKNGKPELKVVSGAITVKKIMLQGKAFTANFKT